MGISGSVSSETGVSSFADDTRLLHGIASEEDCVALQQDLDHVYSWAEEIGMVFNAGGDAGVRDEKQGRVYLTPRDDGLDLTFSCWTHLDVSWGKGR